MNTLLLLLLLNALHAETNSSEGGYAEPPKHILDVMRAPSPPLPLLSPNEEQILLESAEDYPSITRVAEPFLRLAGVRVEPKNHARHDTEGGYGIPACVRRLELVDVKTRAGRPIPLDQLTCADRPQWNATGTQFALANRTVDAVELWVGDVRTARLRRVPGARLNPMFGSELQWMPDQKHLLVKLVPKNLGASPTTAAIAQKIEPTIQVANGERGASSTYEKRDTLKDARDEALFDDFGRAQLALVDATRLKVAAFGPPGLFADLQPAPDGVNVLVSAIAKPYSRVTTFERFPVDVAVWTLNPRRRIVTTPIAKLPLADRVPVRGVRTGPRDFSWRADRPATLIWAEALDQGDWNVKVPARDKLMSLSAPFTAAPSEVIRVEQRFAGLQWLESADQQLLTQYDLNAHWTRTTIVSLDDAKFTPRVLFDRSTDEKYLNPGQPILKTLSNGYGVVRYRDHQIFLAGRGGSERGDRPFLDRLDLETRKTTRWFRSDAAEYEQFLGFQNPGETSFLTWRQTAEDVPNAYLRTLKRARAASELEAQFDSDRVEVTHIADPVPEVRQIKKRLINYKRADGLDLSFTLLTPPGYREGTRVPTILYAYPWDYADAAKAGQVSGSAATYTRLKNYRLLLLAGYAIIDQAAFPVVGDPKRAYDTYLEQIVADAKAAVGEAVRLGVADPARIGVTGHSHGALMTANLLAHTDLFRAGVATSGSYNKTLTPFGFQSERRSVWQAPEVYRQVSPFFVADKIKTPLLIIHGADDANPGTTPIQASLLFDAIRGNGGVTRLVMLPHEPHWYTAFESNAQVVYEMLTWFDRFVKGGRGGS